MNGLSKIFWKQTIIARKTFPWIEFRLYGQRHPEGFLAEINQVKGCRHYGVVMPLDKRFDIMKQAHCFAIPSSFRQENHKHYKYSFPTKLPELIASGKPIISYGPKDTATNRVLESDNIGIRIHQRSIDQLTKTILNLAEDYKSHHENSINVKNRVIDKISASKQRFKLSSIITEL